MNEPTVSSSNKRKYQSENINQSADLSPRNPRYVVNVYFHKEMEHDFILKADIKLSNVVEVHDHLVLINTTANQNTKAFLVECLNVCNGKLPHLQKKTKLPFGVMRVKIQHQYGRETVPQIDVAQPVSRKMRKKYLFFFIDLTSNFFFFYFFISWMS